MATCAGNGMRLQRRDQAVAHEGRFPGTGHAGDNGEPAFRECSVQCLHRMDRVWIGVVTSRIELCPNTSDSRARWRTMVGWLPARNPPIRDAGSWLTVAIVP